MFNIGDKVVYPMHGAGIIESIEEKEMVDTVENYYIIRMPVDGVKAMIPISKAKNVGVREISEKETSFKVYSILEEPLTDLTLDTNWNKRYKANIDKIKSGSLEEVTEVFKDLSHRHLEKGLSLGEKKMLSTTKNILLSELALLEEVEHSVLDERIESLVKTSYDNYLSENKSDLL
jgi:CarD family transcriptional regulator